MHDLVIRGGFLVDGTGAPGRQPTSPSTTGRSPRSPRPGRSSGSAASTTIDADGLLVTPGWVDVHTHYDGQASWDPFLTPSSWHGVTTVVMGNCGVGFAPAAPDRHEWLIELMEGVEDIPGTALTEGMTWEWESFEEYLDALDARHYAIDVGTQVAHGPVRGYVMGERGAANEPATAADIEAMAAIVERGLRAGALGFSTSRTPIHRSKSGELVPGTNAAADELYGIADALRRAGHGVFQFAPDHVEVPTGEWPWMRELARRTGRTVSVNLNQPNSAPDLWRDVLGLLDDAAADGIPIVAQVAGRLVGLLMCLEGSFNPLAFHPAFRSYVDRPLDEQVAALRRPTCGGRWRSSRTTVGCSARSCSTSSISGGRWPTATSTTSPMPTPRSARSPARTGQHPIGLVIDQLLAHDGHGMILTPFFNYAYGNLDFTYEAHLHPGTRMGLADAGAHCGVICDGGTPTFMLTHWTRDRTRGPKLPLEHVIHRQTRQTAELYGIGDRGIVAPGMRADLNVIDYEHLTFGPPRMVHDLPAGARRLVQKASGYVATFVDGVRTVDHDEFTGALPGRLLRGPR